MRTSHREGPEGDKLVGGPQRRPPTGTTHSSSRARVRLPGVHAPSGGGKGPAPAPVGPGHPEGLSLASEAHCRDRGHSGRQPSPFPHPGQPAAHAHAAGSQPFPELESQSKDHGSSSSESQSPRSHAGATPHGGDLSAPPGHFCLQRHLGGVPLANVPVRSTLSPPGAVGGRRPASREPQGAGAPGSGPCAVVQTDALPPGFGVLGLVCQVPSVGLPTGGRTCPPCAGDRHL